MVTRSPLLDAAGFEHIGEAADVGVQLLVGDLLVVLGIVAFPDDGGLVAALGEMAIDAIVGGVERAVLEPFDRDVMRVERGVLDLGEGLDPIDALGLFGPEAVRILDRARVHLIVLGVVDQSALLPIGRNVIDLVGHRNSSQPTLRRGRLLARCYTYYATASSRATRRRPHTLVVGRIEKYQGGREFRA